MGVEGFLPPRILSIEHTKHGTTKMFRLDVKDPAKKTVIVLGWHEGLDEDGLSTAGALADFYQTRDVNTIFSTVLNMLFVLTPRYQKGHGMTLVKVYSWYGACWTRN